MIVRVNVGLLLLTVTDVSTTCAVVIFRVKVSLSCFLVIRGQIRTQQKRQREERQRKKNGDDRKRKIKLAVSKFCITPLD